MNQINKRSYFGAARRGELAENRAGLNSNYADERKDAIKRVIANMTVGKVGLASRQKTMDRADNSASVPWIWYS